MCLDALGVQLRMQGIDFVSVARVNGLIEMFPLKVAFKLYAHCKYVPVCLSTLLLLQSTIPSYSVPFCFSLHDMKKYFVLVVLNIYGCVMHG